MFALSILTNLAGITKNKYAVKDLEGNPIDVHASHVKYFESLSTEEETVTAVVGS